MTHERHAGTYIYIQIERGEGRGRGRAKGELHGSIFLALKLSM